MALTKVRGGAIDNPLTLGGGSASDRSIIFDGNAQDFHIGLDDSEDKLTIGLGSTLGTTSHMVIDANGHITKPLQPCFLAQKNAQQTNLSVGGYHDVTFELERFDVGGNFASNTFTAPVTGKYQLNLTLRIDNLDTDSPYALLYITTSNRGYYQLVDTDIWSSDLDYHCFQISVVADMDANDTAKAEIKVQAGAAQSDIDGGTGDPVTFFSGYLLG
tara:strand:- start:9 stop:656 length:648 start_codon:yes stop_codon:yes gene_type:complete